MEKVHSSTGSLRMHAKPDSFASEDIDEPIANSMWKYLFAFTFPITACIITFLMGLSGMANPYPQKSPFFHAVKSSEFHTCVVVSIVVAINLLTEAAFNSVLLCNTGILQSNLQKKHRMLLDANGKLLVSLGYIVSDLYLLLHAIPTNDVEVVRYVLNAQQIMVITFVMISIENYCSDGKCTIKYFRPIVYNTLVCSAILLQMSSYFLENSMARNAVVIFSVILHVTSAPWILGCSAIFFKDLHRKVRVFKWKPVTANEKNNVMFLIGFLSLYICTWLVFYITGHKDWIVTDTNTLCAYMYILSLALYGTTTFPQNVSRSEIFQVQRDLEAKRELMANVSMEVAWPHALLKRALWHAELVQMSADEKEDQVTRNALTDIQHACNASMTLLENLGMFGKVEGQGYRFQLSEVSLDKLMEEIIADLQFQVKSVHIAIIYVNIADNAGPTNTSKKVSAGVNRDGKRSGKRAAAAGDDWRLASDLPYAGDIFVKVDRENFIYAVRNVFFTSLNAELQASALTSPSINLQLCCSYFSNKERSTFGSVVSSSSVASIASSTDRKAGGVVRLQISCSSRTLAPPDNSQSKEPDMADDLEQQSWLSSEDLPVTRFIATSITKTIIRAHDGDVGPDFVEIPARQLSAGQPAAVGPGARGRAGSRSWENEEGRALYAQGHDMQLTNEDEYGIKFGLYHQIATSALPRKMNDVASNPDSYSQLDMVSSLSEEV